MSTLHTLTAAFLLLSMPMLLTSCGGGGVPTIVFREHDLADRTLATQSRGSIEISVEPLKPSAIYQHPDLFLFSTQRLTGNFSSLTLNTYYPEDYQKNRWCFTLSPGNNLLVAYKVRIRNGTSHILRMRDARIYLMIEGLDPIPAATLLGNPTLVQTSVGQDRMLLPKSYIQGDGSLIDQTTREEEEYERTRPKSILSLAYPIGLASQVIAQNLKAYKLVNDVSREILPGTVLDGLLVFPVYAGSIRLAKLMFYDITTKTDAAGNPTEKVTFEFPIRTSDQQMWFDTRQERRWKIGVPPSEAGD